MKNGSKAGPTPSAVLGLHHNAYRCRDAEETRHFYEDVLGLPLVHVVKEPIVPSTGENTPFAHRVLRAEGRILHRVLRSWRQREARAIAEYARMGQPLRDQGAVGEGRRGHEGAARGERHRGRRGHRPRFVKSIYFFDPNGIRLEFTAETATHDELKEYARDGARARSRPGTRKRPQRSDA